MRKGERRRSVFSKRKNLGVRNVQCNVSSANLDVSSETSVGLLDQVGQSDQSRSRPIEVESVSKQKLSDLDSKYSVKCNNI